MEEKKKTEPGSLRSDRQQSYIKPAELNYSQNVCVSPDAFAWILGWEKTGQHSGSFKANERAQYGGGVFDMATDLYRSRGIWMHIYTQIVGVFATMEMKSCMRISDHHVILTPCRPNCLTSRTLPLEMWSSFRSCPSFLPWSPECFASGVFIGLVFASNLHSIKRSPEKETHTGSIWSSLQRLPIRGWPRPGTALIWC